jgi:hypothetical protein
MEKQKILVLDDDPLGRGNMSELHAPLSWAIRESNVHLNDTICSLMRECLFEGWLNMACENNVEGVTDSGLFPALITQQSANNVLLIAAGCI